jgi:hypothetical protein
LEQAPAITISKLDESILVEAHGSSGVEQIRVPEDEFSQAVEDFIGRIASDVRHDVPALLGAPRLRWMALAGKDEPK